MKISKKRKDAAMLLAYESSPRISFLNQSGEVVVDYKKTQEQRKLWAKYNWEYYLDKVKTVL